MNHLLSFIIAIAIFLIIYYYINKTKEHFNDIQEEVEDEQQANELVKKHQIGYADKVYDFNYMIDTDGASVENPKNRVTLWNPISQTGLYNVGTAISPNSERPDVPYTALDGAELINPVKYDMLYRHGESPRIIAKNIDDITKTISDKTVERDEYKKQIDIYDQSDDRYHVCEVWNSANFRDRHYPVISTSYWSSQRHNSNYHRHPNQWHRYLTKHRYHTLTNILIPRHLIIDIYRPVRENNRWKWRTFSIAGWNHTDHSKPVQYSTVGGKDPRTGAGNDPNEEKDRRKYDVVTILPEMVDLVKLFRDDMRHDIEYSNVRKNTAVRSLWQQRYDALNKEIKDLEDKKRVVGNALNKGMFTIWRAVPPEGYKTFGDILLNGHNKPMLSDIKCIPERCSKETREWKLEDKLLSFRNDGMRYNLYRNPFHMTLHVFIEKQVNGSWEYVGQNPENSKIFRVYPCVPKCNYVDDLIKSNECAQNMCLNKKKELNSRPLRYRKSDTEAENMILDEIKEQDLLLEQLKKTAKELQLKDNKFNIVHKEFNRHELKHFLQNQGQLHRDTINKLFKSKNGVAVNINSPGGLEALKSMLRDYLIHHANMLKNKKGQEGQNMGGNCTNWTEFKQNHRCKYSDPPCFGCVNPN